IRQMAKLEYNDNIDKAIQARERQQLPQAINYLEQALSVEEKYSSSLPAVDADSLSNVEDFALLPDHNERALELKTQYEKESPLFPRFQRLLQQAERQVALEDYIAAVRTYEQAAALEINPQQVADLISSAKITGKKYYTGFGDRHFSNGANFEIALGFYKNALLLSDNQDTYLQNRIKECEQRIGR
ncbi:MAG: hypothetical protein KDD04_09360, partial [Sinomicrobium sp.]|nr:hypothetical protein [Sinomicrobium sp.]